MVKKIKKIGWFLLNHLPFHLRYYILFVYNKKRLPRLLYPRDYSDYIASDIFFSRHNKHAFLADKIKVRKYVEYCGLGDILVPMIGTWDDADKISFENLPDQFAIKCNHSCGMNIICYDKSKLDIETTRMQLNKWLQTKHPIFFERHYYHIKPMIFAENLIPSDKEGQFPIDYKIHCAAGKPIFIQVCIDRTEASVGHRVVYSPHWEKLPYTVHDYHYTDTDVPRPKCLNEMLTVASKLSQGLDYARIDLYELNSTKILFGEITLTPMGGWLSFFTQEALDVMGKAIREGKNKKM